MFNYFGFGRWQVTGGREKPASGLSPANAGLCRINADRRCYLAANIALISSAI